MQKICAIKRECVSINFWCITMFMVCDVLLRHCDHSSEWRPLPPLWRITLLLNRLESNFLLQSFL